MKMILLVIIGSIISCQSTHLSESNLNFDYISRIEINKSAIEGVLENFGKADSILDKDDFYSLNYIDKKTGFQRLILNVSKSTNRIIGYLWIPFEGEPEVNIENVMKKFSRSSFKMTKKLDEKSHNIRFEESYTDDSLGISILVDSGTKNVRVISSFRSNSEAKNSRGRASTQVTEVPYFQ